MTEPIAYNDLAAFFRSNYGSSCETMSRIDRVNGDREVNYLQCTTSREGLSTFTVTLPDNGINSFADLNCMTYNFASSNPMIYCESVSGDPWNPDARGFEIVLRKSDEGSLSAIGGQIFTQSPTDISGRPYKLLDYLASVDFGWYWATASGIWYARGCMGWSIP